MLKPVQRSIVRVGVQAPESPTVPGQVPAGLWPAVSPEAVAMPDPTDEGDVREGMRGLPGWLQPFLTWVTGKPLRRQQPMWRGAAALSLAGGLAQLLGGA